MCTRSVVTFVATVFAGWRSGSGDGWGAEQVAAVYEVLDHELGYVGAADGVADPTFP